ncbi:MAG: hypothetical protein IPN95_22365 [Bacteroidetes bacterium]|nr:hypothetical protein [Bacteroidota bacterium]
MTNPTRSGKTIGRRNVNQFLIQRIGSPGFIEKGAVWVATVVGVNGLQWPNVIAEGCTVVDGDVIAKLTILSAGTSKDSDVLTVNKSHCVRQVVDCYLILFSA